MATGHCRAEPVWVNLTAPLDVLEARERTRRRGQKLGNARGHLMVEHGAKWDLELDLSALSPEQAAARIRTTCPFISTA